MSESLRQLDWFNPEQDDYRKYNEVSIYWASSDQGIPCKARLDRVIVTDTHVHVIDLKTTDSVSTDKFQSKLVDLSYDFQAGWYTWAASLAFGLPATFTFVAVERQEPWTVKVFDTSEEMLSEARRKNKKALRILKGCQSANCWPKGEVTRQTLQYPRWYTMTEESASIDTAKMTADDLAGIL
jgi:exodeoxyribonuclease VIII